VNWDAVSTCGSVYEFADNFSSIFSGTTSSYEMVLTDVKFSIFPNPSNDFFYFNADTPLIENEIIKIYNALGEEVFSIAATNTKQSIDVSTWTAGIYFVKCGIYVQKLIIR